MKRDLERQTRQARQPVERVVPERIRPAAIDPVTQQRAEREAAVRPPQSSRPVVRSGGRPLLRQTLRRSLASSLTLREAMVLCDILGLPAGLRDLDGR